MNRLPIINRLLIIISSLLWLSACVSLPSNQSLSNQSDSLLQNGYYDAAAATQISPELLKEELDFIKQQLLAIHPAPFLRYPQSEFEQQFELIRNTIHYPLSRSEFYLRIAPLLANLKDVHSFIHLPKDKMGAFKHLDETLFPLAVIVQNNEVFVAADLSENPSIKSGAQLLSINNAPISFLLNVMQTLIAKETESGQNQKIQMNFAWLLSAMGYAGEVFEVEYLWHDKIVQIQLNGLDLSHEPSPEIVSYYGFSKLNNDTALLWFNDFNEKPEIFDVFLTEKFIEMKQQKLNKLILDIRFNSGGLTENLKNLLSRLTHEPIYWAEKGHIKISEELKAQHQKKTRQRRKDKYSWGLKWLPLEWTNSLQHSILWAEAGDFISLDLEPVLPFDNHKAEGLWVLTNGYCYSACSFFMASVNNYRLGKTIGERAGSLADYQFAYPISIILPHSQLVLTIPTMRLDFSATDLNDLIEPQETLTRTQQDIELRRDTPMLKALDEAQAFKSVGQINQKLD